jgi:magnesium transporter
MIRAQLEQNGELLQGGEELVEQWRQQPGSQLWLDIEGKLDGRQRELLARLGCDPLALQDASRDRHPPKVEEFTDNTFILFRGISELGEDLTLLPQQLALFVGENFLITTHRGKSISIDHFWATVAESPELLADTGLLTVQILHFASGRYLDSVLAFEDRLGALEDALISGDAEDAMKELVAYRSRLRILRRVFNYHQRLAEQIMNGVGAHLRRGRQDQNAHERRDLFDRCERLFSLCNMYYEICGDLVEGYISLSSHRLNNTMKVLTIITAIFVPLSFLAGLYGMNFDNMPELHYRHGYFIVLGLMALLATGMITLFRRIRWL